MGQAKARGSREVRVAEGKARREKEEIAREERRAAEEAAMTPAERKQRKRTRIMMAAMYGLAASSLGSLRP